MEGSPEDDAETSLGYRNVNLADRLVQLLFVLFEFCNVREHLARNKPSQQAINAPAMTVRKGGGRGMGRRKGGGAHG